MKADIVVAVVVVVVALVVLQHMVPRILVFELMARADVDEEQMGADHRMIRKDEELLVGQLLDLDLVLVLLCLCLNH